MKKNTFQRGDTEVSAVAKRLLSKICVVLLVSVFGFALAACSGETYVPEGKQPAISAPTIGTSGVLNVGVDASNAPFSADISGKISGLDVDIAAALADELGLKLNIVDVGSDVDGSLSAGTVDIVMGVDASESTLECWLSESYIESGVSLFASSEGAAIPTADSGSKIAAQTSSMSAWEVTNQFGTDALVPASDLKTAFSQIGSGEFDYVAADAVIGSYAAHVSNSTAPIIALMQQPGGYCMGVLSTNGELQTLIETALQTLVDQGIVNVIETKWLGKPVDLSAAVLTEGADGAGGGGDGAGDGEGGEVGDGSGTEGEGGEGTEGSDTEGDGSGTEGSAAEGDGSSDTPPEE